MKQFGDVVHYIRAGEEMNAIVLNSREIEGREHVSLAYPNQEIKGQMLSAYNVAKATKIDFDVPPMADRANRGWYDPRALDQRPTADLPSAADLDHTAVEQAIQTATANPTPAALPVTAASAAAPSAPTAISETPAAATVTDSEASEGEDKKADTIQ